jgi:hypothetical protein
MGNIQRDRTEEKRIEQQEEDRRIEGSPEIQDQDTCNEKKIEGY